MPEPAALPPLPHLWRPRKARATALCIALAVVLVLGAVALLLPAMEGTRTSVANRIGVFAVGVGIAWFLVRHASVTLTATTEGLRVKNLFRSRVVGWHEVASVSLRKGDPWVTLLLADGDTVAVMAIQASDGPAAPAAARQLARLVARESAKAAPPAA